MDHHPLHNAALLQPLCPRNERELHRFVRVILALDIPRVAMLPGSTAPFDYLAHTFFECGDAVVWANRGGGKTLLGAVATLLDLLFKPGIQIRILGGSLDQSAKMYEHLLALLDRPLLRAVPGLLASPPTQRRIKLTNGSVAEILAQSQTSVRGTRVHKLRCDEVDEFDPRVWQAAQLVTRSGQCGQVMVRGTVDALSTLHRPRGLMSRLVDIQRENGGTGVSPVTGADDGRDARPTIFKWTAMDVIARCSPARPCESCALWDDCQGRAKHANGFVSVDDLLTQHQRTSTATWAAEMMCRSPRASDSVYPTFDVGVHVVGDEQIVAMGYASDGEEGETQWIGGMDFGLRCPTVMLWGMVVENDCIKGEGAASRRPLNGRMGEIVIIMDEYIQNDLTLSQHIVAISAQARRAGWPRMQWLGVDPAGRQRNAHTGSSDIDALRAAGHKVRWRSSRLADGIERVRRRLDHRTLFIHRRCTKLIQAMQTYHFDHERADSDEPVKDGPDHACDALRYMVVNLEAPRYGTMMSRYVI